MSDQMEELGKRHRRAFRALVLLVALFVVCALGVGYFAFTRINATRPGPVAAAPAAPVALATATNALLSAAPVQVSEPASLPPAPHQELEIVKSPVHPQRAAPVRVAAIQGAEAAELPSRAAPAPPVAKPDPSAASFGFLSIDTSPWSTVSVGGRVLGQTPLMNVKLPAGSQMISLRNPEQGIETTIAVTIESGKTLVRRIGIE